MTDPFRYIFASRSGLFLVDHGRWLRAAEGQFFGVTLLDGDVYAFRAELGGWSPDKRNGCIVRYRRDGDRLTEDAVLVRGLVNECHQVDFFDGSTASSWTPTARRSWSSTPTGGWRLRTAPSHRRPTRPGTKATST